MKRKIFIKEIKYLFKILLKNGYEMMLVGGCVRDYLLNKPINDYDLATKYTPQELIKILEQNKIKYLTTGINFGTITVLLNDKKFEITTLRKDIKTDGRHAVVEFADDYINDAKRRDFTFNALYMDYKGKVFDYFNGIQDLKDGNIKFIGNAEERVLEDNLRILRFFRFYNLYCITMDYEGLKACIKYKNEINNLSKERVREEFFKILDSKYCVKTLKIMQNYDILKNILNYDKNLNFDNLEIFYSLQKYINFNFDYLFILILILYHNNGATHNLLLTKKEKQFLNLILNNIPKIINCFEIKKLLFIIKNKEIAKIIIVVYFCSNFTNFEDLKQVLSFLQKITIPQLKITGQDLINANFKDKKNFSKIINELENIYINSNFELDKNEIFEKYNKSK